MPPLASIPVPSSKLPMSESKSFAWDLSDSTVAEIHEATDGSDLSPAAVAEIRETLLEGISALVDGASSIRDMNAVSSHSAWRDDAERKTRAWTREQLLSQIATVLAKHKQLLSNDEVRFQTLSDLAMRRLQSLVGSDDRPANLELPRFDTVRDEESKLETSLVQNKSATKRRKCKK